MNKIVSYSWTRLPRGSATLELIIVLLAILLIWLGGMDLARIIHAHVAVASAVHVGLMTGVNKLQQDTPPAWEIDASNSINILLEAAVKTAISDAAKNDIGKRYMDNLLIEKNEILCRCLRLNVDWVNDSLGNLVACNDTTIANCNSNTTYPRTVRQIFASMQVRLPLDTIFNWPLLPNTYNITGAAIMQGDEI